VSLHSFIEERDPTDEHTCSLWYIRARLGRRDYQDKRMVAYVTRLIEAQSFPPPLPCLKGQDLCAAVTAKSRWLRPAVDAWLEDFLPPANAAQVDQAALNAAAHEMDAAAHGLTLIAGGRS